MYKIKKKLIHFYTHGNIAEDFVTSRRVKVNKIRQVIRLAFYFHCALAIMGIVLSLLFGRWLTMVAMVMCAAVSCGLSLLVVGYMKPLKWVSLGTDLALAMVWFIAGGFAEQKSGFVACGVMMSLCLPIDLSVLCAAWCRGYIEGLNPLLVRREDYTLLRNFNDDLPIEETVEIPLPPLTSEMRELAKQMREVLREGGGSADNRREDPSEIEQKTVQIS